MEESNESSNLWTCLKGWLFMKLGNNLWNYIIVHKDYWGRSYGVSFTHLSDFPKRFKYDMENMPDNMEDIIKKDKKDESNTTAS